MDRVAAVTPRDQGLGHGQARAAGARRCRPRRCTRTCRRRRSERSTSARLSGDVQEQSDAGHGDHERRAAERDERQRHTGDGQHADHGADVHEGLDQDPRRDAGGEEHAVVVGGPQRGADAGHAERHEQGDHQDGADEPELLGDDGEDEVGVGERQEAPLGPALAQPGCR